MSLIELTSKAAEIKDLGSLIGVGVATIALCLTAYNIWKTSLANRARFWLDLRTHFYRYDDVHRKLRPRGEWASGDGPTTVDEWAQVEAYMGLFEHCEMMLEKGLIDERQFSEIYKYRLSNLVANDTICEEKLRKRPEGWISFVALLDRMGIEFKR